MLAPALAPTMLPSSAMPVTSSVPVAWKLAQRPATWSLLIRTASVPTKGGGLSSMKLLGLAWSASQLVKVTVRLQPATERTTSGRGRLSGRSSTLPAEQVFPASVQGTGGICLSTTSRFSAYMM